MLWSWRTYVMRRTQLGPPCGPPGFLPSNTEHARNLAPWNSDGRRNMRIALVIFSYYPAPTIGPIRHVAALSRGLAEKGHDVTIMTSTADVPPATPLFEEIDGVKIERIPVAFRWGHWIRCPDLRLRLIHGRFDLFHTQLYRNYFTEATAKASRSSGVPMIITPRGSLLGYRYLNELPIYSIPNVVFDLLTRRRSLEGSVLVVTSKQEARDAVELGVPS